MEWSDAMRPKLRPVEARRVPDADPPMIALRDPSGLSPASLTVSEPVLYVLGHLDGRHTLTEIDAAFVRGFGRALPREQLEAILTHLRKARFLDDEEFEAHYRDLVTAYLAGPSRHMLSAGPLGIDGSIGQVFETMMDGRSHAEEDGRIVGIVAPHLDYARGAPCYGAAYGALRGRATPERVVILGTNHFGRSSSVVVTGKDFETPLGTTRTDAAFIDQLEARCGDLSRHELDHQREHSVELQLLWCQHLFGAGRFTMVPALCPDPCGPTGTEPFDGQGVDLRDFAQGLRECIERDGSDTLVIAGADLSHVGAQFGDRRRLEGPFLAEVRDRDHRALDALCGQTPDDFLACVRDSDNPTRVCSVGSMFALASAVPDATIRQVAYHQAVDDASQTGVTCAALLVTR